MTNQKTYAIINYKINQREVKIMLNKVLDSIQREKEALKKCFDPIKGYDWAFESKERILSNAQARVVGVCMFAEEYLGVKYEDINPFFEDFVKFAEKMKKGVDKKSK